MNEIGSEPCELAEIVYEKPFSGDFVEVPFGSGLGNTLWVKFSDLNGLNEWIGKFEDGNHSGRRVAKIAEPDKFFVSAGGFAYFVDATHRKLLPSYQKNNVLDIVYDSPKDLLIVGSHNSLNWIDADDKVIASKKIS